MDKALTELRSDLEKSRKAVRGLEAKKKDSFIAWKKQTKDLAEQITAEKKKGSEIVKQIQTLKYGSDRDNKGRPINKSRKG